MAIRCPLVHKNVDRPESTDQSWDTNYAYGSNPILF
jgi:hypothetical protein